MLSGCSSLAFLRLSVQTSKLISEFWGDPLHPLTAPRPEVSLWVFAISISLRWASGVPVPRTGGQPVEA